MSDRKFYDLHTAFEGEKEAIIKRAEELELEGICLVHCYKGEKELQDYISEILKLREKSKVQIISGVMLYGDDMEKIAQKIRKKVDLLLAYGGKYNINRAACSSDLIDILCHPERERRDCGIDHICCKEAKEHNTIIELNFRRLLTSAGSRKVRELHLMKELVRLCTKTGAPFIVNSGARTPWELRGGRELAALSCALGANLYQSLVSNSEVPEKLISENRKRVTQPLRGVYLQYER